MVATRLRMTVEEFERWTELPENAEKKRLEFVAGEVVEVPSNAYASAISAEILVELGIYLRQNRIGWLTGEAGGYQIGDERYAPDVAFVASARQAMPDRSGYNRLAPDLAVEVEYPETAASGRILRVKLSNYLAAGTTVWVIFPESAQVEVHSPGQPVRLYNADDTLDGGGVLPGFTLPLSQIFPNAAPMDQSGAESE